MKPIEGKTPLKYFSHWLHLMQGNTNDDFDQDHLWWGPDPHRMERTDKLQRLCGCNLCHLCVVIHKRFCANDMHGQKRPEMRHPRSPKRKLRYGNLTARSIVRYDVHASIAKKLNFLRNTLFLLSSDNSSVFRLCFKVEVAQGFVLFFSLIRFFSGILPWDCELNDVCELAGIRPVGEVWSQCGCFRSLMGKSSSALSRLASANPWLHSVGSDQRLRG